MRKIFIFIVLACFSVNLFSQSVENLPDGYHIFRYPNGSKSSEGMIRNGKPDGYWKSYYVTGIVKSEGKRTNFMLDSVWIFYDQTGDTLEKINYLYGKKNGYYYKYKKDPAYGIYVYSKELYAGDKREGTAYIYFPDGKIKQTINYRNGKKEGLSKEYNQNGEVVAIFEYSNDFLINREKINSKDEKGLRQGTWKEFYPSGAIKSECYYKNDLLHGYYKEYDEKGNLILTMLYEEGKIVKSNINDEKDIEIVNRYDESGKLIYSGPYRNKVPVGTHREYKNGEIVNAKIYNDNGILVSEGIVDEAGNRNGNWKDFYPDGKIKAEGQYSENRKTGLWKFYSPNGNIEQIGYYANDRPNGLWTWYYEDGTLLREEEYFQGQRDGMYTEYSRTGEIIANGQYSDGERNGEWIFKSGESKEEGKFIMGLRDGVWKSYYPDGKLKYKGNYVQGNADGLHIYYYDNGNIKEERYYKMGIREKTWRKYNEDGTLFLTITYKNDVEVSINGIKIKLPESDVKLIK